MAKRRLSWRVNAPDGEFDELVVYSKKGDALVHAEMMTDRAIFVSVGALNVWAYVKKDGTVKVTAIENETGCRPWTAQRQSEGEKP
jgi:hypothetical protein